MNALNAKRETPNSKLMGAIGATLWLLLCVLVGVTDLRDELHDLGLGR